MSVPAHANRAQEIIDILSGETKRLDALQQHLDRNAAWLIFGDPNFTKESLLIDKELAARQGLGRNTRDRQRRDGVSERCGCCNPIV